VTGEWTGKGLSLEFVVAAGKTGLPIRIVGRPVRPAWALGWYSDPATCSYSLAVGRRSRVRPREIISTCVQSGQKLLI